MNSARFFEAPEVMVKGFNTWQKLFVLTEDNILYCEYLEWNNPAKVIKEFDYKNFNASDYSWGRGEFQHLREIDYETARNIKLINQKNWIDRYLGEQGIK